MYTHSLALSWYGSTIYPRLITGSSLLLTSLPIPPIDSMRFRGHKYYDILAIVISRHLSIINGDDTNNFFYRNNSFYKWWFELILYCCNIATIKKIFVKRTPIGPLALLKLQRMFIHAGYKMVFDAGPGHHNKIKHLRWFPDYFPITLFYCLYGLLYGKKIFAAP